jgi:non-heme chloroperoxidase
VNLKRFDNVYAFRSQHPLQIFRKTCNRRRNVMKSHTVIGGSGLKLNVSETGHPEGQPILFIHGFSQCRLAWNKQMNSDLTADFRLVAMDIRGHGLSEKPRDVYGDPKLWADDVDAVITALGLQKTVLCGWSYGGVILSDYVNYYGEEKIAGTVWVGAVSRLGDALVQPGFIGPDFLACVPGFFSENVQESIDALDKLLRICFHQELSAEDFYCLLGYNAIVPPHVRQGLLSRNVNNDSIIERMRKPMLLSYGDHDRIALTSMRIHLAALAGHARLSVYPNVGHAPFWEASQRFNRELVEFCQSLEARATGTA